ncbi:MAG: PsbP-related protein [Candidatus Acidiferrum sp.]
MQDYWGVRLVFLLLVSFGIGPLPGGPNLKGTHQDKSKAAAQAKDSETANWKTLKNKWGWEIKYPADWKVFENPQAGPAISGVVEFYSPGDCVNERCASFDINSDINQGTVKDFPEEEAKSQKNDPNLFFRRRFQLGGFPAIDACWYEPKANEGQLVRRISVIHKGREIEITYAEGGRGKVAIKTLADSKYMGTFDKILSTMSFYDVPESVWPSL